MSLNDEQLSNIKFKANKVPPFKELPDGKRETTWNIVLKNPVSEKNDLKSVSEKLSHKNFNVRVEVEKGIYLTVSIVAPIEPNPYIHDPIIFSEHKIFERIEQLLGEIYTIQGQKIEDRWSPYRKSKNKK